MADDFQDKLSSMLSNPDLMRTLSALAGGLGSSSADNLPAAGGDSVPDIGTELSSVVNSINDSNDSRINLLYALRPYMRSARAEQMDMAIKILKLTKLTSLL